MNKSDFLNKLRKGLAGLPKEDIEERITFYSEIIDDKLEEGLTEEQAINEIEDVDAIVSQTLEDVPFTKLVKEKIAVNKKFKAWEIVLLALGSPIWLSLLIAAVSVIFSVYISFWAVIISLWAVFGSIIGCAIGGMAASVVFAFGGKVISCIAMLGAGLVCAGVSVFAFYGCKALTTLALFIAKKTVLGIKKCFIKEDA